MRSQKHSKRTKKKKAEINNEGINSALFQGCEYKINCPRYADFRIKLGNVSGSGAEFDCFFFCLFRVPK